MSYLTAKEQHCQTAQFSYKSPEHRCLLEYMGFNENLYSYSYMCLCTRFSLLDQGETQKDTSETSLLAFKPVLEEGREWGVVWGLGFFKCLAGFGNLRPVTRA